MLKEERETVVNFNSTDKTASMYTSQPEVWRKLERLSGFKLLEQGKIDGKVVSKEFEIPKSFVRLTKTGLKIGHPKIVSAKFREEAGRRLSSHRILGKPIVNQVPSTSEPVQHGKPRQEVEKC